MHVCINTVTQRSSISDAKHVTFLLSLNSLDEEHKMQIKEGGNEMQQVLTDVSHPCIVLKDHLFDGVGGR